MSGACVRIETDRLILRPIQAEDFEGCAILMGDAENARHIGGPQPRAVAWRGFLSMAGAWAIQGFGMFSVIEKSSGRWIGRLGPWHHFESFGRPKDLQRAGLLKAMVEAVE